MTEQKQTPDKRPVKILEKDIFYNGHIIRQSTVYDIEVIQSKK